MAPGKSRSTRNNNQVHTWMDRQRNILQPLPKTTNDTGRSTPRNTSHAQPSTKTNRPMDKKNHTTQAIGSLNPMESLLLRQKSKTTQLN